MIYRNSKFDKLCKQLDFDVFNVFRDRQITNKLLSNRGDIRVLKSRNISDNGKTIVDIEGYDSYIGLASAKNLSVFEYLQKDNVYLTPNMTYKPRMIKKPKNTLVNGSLAILVPKGDIVPTKEQIEFFSKPEYREFYQISRNYQTLSLNVDACSVFFYGLLRKDEKITPITEKLNNSENIQLLLFI